MESDFRAFIKIMNASLLKAGLNYQYIESPLVVPTVPTVPTVQPITTPNKFDYKKALELTMYGFSWQVSGKKPSWSTNPNRGDSFLTDGLIDAKKDLSGGFHNAGDCIKVVLPAFSNCAQLAFSGLFFKDGYERTNTYSTLVDVIRHYCDWGLKCHEINAKGETTKLWHWVSLDTLDHSIMLPPERQEKEFYAVKNKHRQCFAIGDGAEPVGEEPPSMMAACFALVAMLLKAEDSSYAAKLLNRAKSLFEFAKARRGKYQAHTVYASNSYGDEITFAATALYLATLETKYLDEAEQLFDKHIQFPVWTWIVGNCSSVTTFLLAYATKKEKYISMCKTWLSSWIKGNNKVRRHSDSPLRSNSDEGTIPQFTATFGLAKFGNKYLNLGLKEVDAISVQGMNYCLGDNPKGFSWLGGYGTNYPKNTHHCSLMATSSVVGKGLWVAGERSSGLYYDKFDEWVTNECGCYNSAVAMLLAALV